MVSEMKQAYTEMLRITSTWTSRSVIQTLSVTCIVLANCRVLLEATEKLGHGAAFPQLQIQVRYVKCPWVELGVRWSPTEVAIIYSTVCKCLQVGKRSQKNSTMRSSSMERKLNLESSQVVLHFASTQFNDVSPVLLFVLLLRSLT